MCKTGSSHKWFRIPQRSSPEDLSRTWSHPYLLLYQEFDEHFWEFSGMVVPRPFSSSQCTSAGEGWGIPAFLVSFVGFRNVYNFTEPKVHFKHLSKSVRLLLRDFPSKFCCDLARPCSCLFSSSLPTLLTSTLLLITRAVRHRVLKWAQFGFRNIWIDFRSLTDWLVRRQ